MEIPYYDECDIPGIIWEPIQEEPMPYPIHYVKFTPSTLKPYMAEYPLEMLMGMYGRKPEDMVCVIRTTEGKKTTAFILGVSIHVVERMKCEQTLLAHLIQKSERDIEWGGSEEDLDSLLDFLEKAVHTDMSHSNPLEKLEIFTESLLRGLYYLGKVQTSDALLTDQFLQCLADKFGLDIVLYKVSEYGLNKQKTYAKGVKRGTKVVVVDTNDALIFIQEKIAVPQDSSTEMAAKAFYRAQAEINKLLEKKIC